MGIWGRLRRFYGRKGSGPTYIAELASARIVAHGPTQEAALHAMKETLSKRLSAHLSSEVEPGAVRISLCELGCFEVEAPELKSLLDRSNGCDSRTPPPHLLVPRR